MHNEERTQNGRIETNITVGKKNRTYIDNKEKKEKRAE